MQIIEYIESSFKGEMIVEYDMDGRINYVYIDKNLRDNVDAIIKEINYKNQFIKKTHIEDCHPVLQKYFRELLESENDMIFIEKDEVIGCDISELEDNVKKLGIDENAIRFDEDDALCTIFGGSIECIIY